MNGGNVNVFNFNCLNFVYPISFVVYNSNSDTNSNVNVGNDTELISLLNSGTQIVDFIYPFVLTSSNGQNITINNITNLQNTLQNTNNFCN
jgi:hypothetical protein